MNRDKPKEIVLNEKIRQAATWAQSWPVLYANVIPFDWGN